MPDLAVDSARLASLYAAGIVAVFAAASIVVHVVLSVVASRRRQIDSHSLAAALLTTCKGPVVLFTVLLGLLLAFQVLASSTDAALSWMADYREWALRVWMVLVAVIASYLATHILEALSLWYLENVAERTASDIDDRIMAQVRRFVPLVVYSVGVLLSLDILGVSITPLIAGLGIAGIAVALALQPTLGNLFSGTYLAVEGELNEGDFVELDGGAVRVRGRRGLAQHEDTGPVQQHDHHPELDAGGQHPHELLQLLEGDVGAGGVRGELRVGPAARGGGDAGGGGPGAGRPGGGRGRVRSGRAVHGVRRLEHRPSWW